MASQYEGLPIYKATADLVVMLDRCVRGFPRYHKYTLGSRLREGSVELYFLLQPVRPLQVWAKALPGVVR